MSSESPRSIAALLLMSLATLASGCKYNENLPEKDLHGVVRIPKSLADVQISDLDGNQWTISDDVRAIGPVYIGVYAGIDDTLYDYPHPEWGPVLDDTKGGDAYPYGGTSAGRFAWGCYQSTVCKTVTGRFDGYQDVLDFFRDVVKAPITDYAGNEITSAEQYQERCFLDEYVTSNDELDLVGPLDFTDQGDYFEADVTILHTQYLPGATIWGFADMPSPTYSFSTCDDSNGAYHYYYEESYYEGTNFQDVLNFPGLYIGSGDLVSDNPVVVDDPEQDFVLELGYKYEN
ncbi:MAG: hypothetical protein GXP62_00465 [Oligoflexia bacterium]|nr:hypothetical protein [Oligoflexia bacterium]